MTLWDFSHHKDVEKVIIERNDKMLLKFISIIISKSISKFGLFGAHFSEYIKFVNENSLDLNNISEVINFLNQLQNRALERNFFNYRFNISLSGTAINNLLIVRIECDPNSETILSIINKLSIFGWNLFIKLLDGFYFLVLGPDYNHFIAKLIEDVLIQNKIKSEIFSVKNMVHRYVAYDELYDFNSQKWSLF